MGDREWVARIPVATDEEMAALVVACRLGQQRCPATCRLHKGADGAWSPPAGWGARDRYGWYCPARTP
jgi:hypothetical protein